MKKYGLIGFPLTHSFSRAWFTKKFETEHITDSVYENFSIPQIEDLEEILQKEKDLCGLNVTIPYKEQVMDYLDLQDEVVAAIGACNCIRIQKGILTGHNTDVVGFESSLKKKLAAHHKAALVLGSGGASKAVIFVLKKLGMDYRIVSRKPATDGLHISYTDLTEELMQSNTLLINTTPLGMYPETGTCPPIPFEFISSRHYLYDLVYNPAQTIFLQKGKQKGATIENGSDMLVIQAEESWRIWNES